MANPNGTNVNSNGYKSNLFYAVRPNDGLGADVLVPGTSNTTSIVDENQQTKGLRILGSAPTLVVDVHNEYPWTLSPVFARESTPIIEITEYKQVLSSELMGYAYSLAGTIDNFRVAAKTLPTAVAGVAGVTKQATTALSFIPGAGVVGDVAKLIGNNLINTGFVAGTERIQQINKAAQESTNQDVIKNDPNNAFLAPYRGLYAVEPTGFVYRLPYASQENFSQTNGWGDPEGQIAKAAGSVLTSLIGEFGDSGEGQETVDGAKDSTATKLGRTAGRSILDVTKGVMTAAGGVIKAEKPKSYQGPQTTDSVTVKFILYNTVNFSDIKRNWELCYLLSYQNLPNRKGINLMDPPKLYRLLIPGYKQFPMCWVTNLKIKNLGAVRMVDIDNPNRVITYLGADVANYSPSVKMIPEAYEIEITFEHAFYSSQNLYAYALQPSNVVTTTVSLTETLQTNAPTPPGG